MRPHLPEAPLCGDLNSSKGQKPKLEEFPGPGVGAETAQESVSPG